MKFEIKSLNLFRDPSNNVPLHIFKLLNMDTIRLKGLSVLSQFQLLLTSTSAKTLVYLVSSDTVENVKLSTNELKSYEKKLTSSGNWVPNSKVKFTIIKTSIVKVCETLLVQVYSKVLLISSFFFINRLFATILKYLLNLLNMLFLKTLNCIKIAYNIPISSYNPRIV